MPNLQNAKKALRQAEKRTIANTKLKRAYKDAIKKVTKGLAAGKTELSEEIKFAQKKLGKATKRGVIKKNTAARKLSRLMKKVHAGAKK